MFLRHIKCYIVTSSKKQVAKHTTNGIPGRIPDFGHSMIVVRMRATRMLFEHYQVAEESEVQKPKIGRNSSNNEIVVEYHFIPSEKPASGAE